MTQNRSSNGRIGDLNGVWGKLFQIALVLIVPFSGTVLVWGTWATNEIILFKIFRESSEQFSQRDGRELEIKQDKKRIEALMPIQNDLRDIRDSYMQMSSDVKWIRQTIEKSERTNGN